jgi:hypothetical protein
MAFTPLNLLAGEHALALPGTREVGNNHRFVERRVSAGRASTLALRDGLEQLTLEPALLPKSSVGIVPGFLCERSEIDAAHP